MISARTASSAAASEPRAHKSDASHRTLRSLLRKNMADKNDSGGRGGERRAFGLEIHCRRASQLRVSVLLFCSGQFTVWHRCINIENIASITTLYKSSGIKNYTND